MSSSRRLVLFLLLCLFASTAPAARTELASVALQLKWRHQFQFAGYYAALEKGYYREAGLDVNIQEAMPGLDTVKAVAEGKAEFGVGNSDLLLARHQGKPVVVLATIFQHSPACILALRGRGIRSISDLAGRTLATEASSADLLAFLKRAGLTPDRLKLVPYQPDNLALLESGQLDAAPAYVTNEPFELSRRGIPFLEFRPISGGIDFYGDNLYTTDRLLRDKPEMVAAFRSASLKGWRYALEHPDEIVDLILRKYRPDADRAHLVWEADRIRDLVMPELVDVGYMSPERWRRMAEIYTDVGFLPAGWNFNGLLYNPQTPTDLRHLYAGLLGTGALVLAMGGFILVVLRSRRRLAASQARFDRTEATLPGVLFDFIRWPDGRETLDYVSARCVDLLGLTPEELKADASRIWSMIHPEDLTGFKAARDAARENRTVFLATARLILPDARVRWMQFSARANPVPTLGGLLWSGFMLDVTEQRQAEAAHARSEGQYQAVVAAMGEGVLRVDAKGRIEDCNPAAERILGLARRELLGKSVTTEDWRAVREDGARFPPGDYPVSHTLRSGASHREVLLGLDLPQGGQRWLSISSDPITSRYGGRLEGAVVTFSDVSELRSAEQLLKASEKRFRDLFAHSPIAYQSLDRDGRFIDVNEPLCLLLGAEREGLIGRPFSDFWAWPESFAGAFQRFKAEGQVSTELDLVRLDGVPRTVLLEGRVQRDGEGGFLRSHCVLTDITDRKTMENALRESEGRFRTMANAAPVLIWVSDDLGGCMWFNQTWLDFTGRPLEQEAGEGWAQGVHADDRAVLMADYRQRFEARQPFRFEYRLRRHDGEYRWIVDVGVPRFGETGEFAGYIGSCVDVTENKEAEALLRGILDAAEEGILVVASNGNILAYNRAFVDIWEVPKGLPEQGKDALLAHVAARQQDPEAYQAQVEALYHSDAEQEDELQSLDGRAFLRYTRSLQVGGQPARVWTFRDISQLMQSQKAIRDERARLRTLLETIPEAIWLKDPEGIYLACNPAFERVYDTTEAALVGHTDYDFTDRANADFLRDKDKEAMAADRTIVSEEWVTYPATGDKVLMAKHKTPVRDGDGRLIGVLGMGRDITEERRASATLAEARDQAEAANRAKSLFLSRMSHELRTPLNAIIGFSELLKLDTDSPLAAQQLEFVDHILNGGTHLLELVNEVLDLSKIESGKLEMNLEPVSLPHLMGECLHMSRPQAARRGIHLEGASQARRAVLADPVRLRQVLLNLLSNAIKYNRDGGTVSVSCSAAPHNRIHIAVSDTGPGIPEARQGEVFQPFQRLGAEKTSIEGTGIGLAISKRIVEAMEGSIGFQSRPNQGATFWLELPAAESGDGTVVPE